MDIYTIDFETYYDRDYSLSKITTEMYVRDERFEAILVGIKKNNGPVKWIPKPLIAAFLKAIDFSKAAILCHNTAFDGAILSWHYGVKPKLWLDTLSMARPLHNVTVGGSLKALVQYYKLGAKGDEVINALGKGYADFSKEELNRYADYCVNDVELTYKLWLKLKREFPQEELLVIDQTLRMYTEPKIELDRGLLLQHLNEVRSCKEKLLDLVAEALNDGAAEGIGREALKPVLMSNPQMATLLEKLGVEPPTKVSAKTGKVAFAFSKTDAAFTDLLEHPDERVRAAVEARLGVKSTLEETRTLAFLGIGERGPLPIMLNYYGAHTGRFSGGDKVNLQNLPSRGNTTIRRALKAPDGHEIIACDSSQIEARTVAWLAGQDDLVQSFREGRDVYSEFASEVYGRTITKADYTERFVGKTCILGLGYGMGGEKFRRTLALAKIEIDEFEAERIVRLYRQKYFKITQLWQVCGGALTNMMQGRGGSINDRLTYDNTGILLPNGLKITYPALRQTGSGFEYINDARIFRKYLKDRVLGLPCDDLPWIKIYGGKVVENLVQALAGIIVRGQMVDIGLAGYFVAFQVHDENVCVVPSEGADAAEAHIIRLMSKAPAWAPDLPVACEAGRATNYGDC
jgi:DNA polymerase I-like protein with 3'-5' exonuclease and polymerase domains